MPRRSDAGYNLVFLMITVTVLNVLVAAALPLWSQAMKRDREEELIFRGLQYAEAIRIFQRRHGRFPTRLEELLEVEPRSIRRLWKDPITESGDWGVIFAGQAPGQPPQGQEGAPQIEGGAAPESPLDAPPGEGQVGEGGVQEVRVGPIHGVYSLSDEESVKTFLGATHYNQWRFTVDLVMVGGGTALGAGQPRVTAGGTRWVGRPFRPGIAPQLPGQPAPGGKPAPGEPDGRTSEPLRPPETGGDDPDGER